MIDIMFFCGIEAVLFHRAVHHTAFARPRRLFGGIKLKITAEAGHLSGSDAAFQPHDQIHVMAALCQQHRRAAFFLVAPFAAYKRYGQMMVADMLRRLNIDDIADFTRKQAPLDLRIKGRVPQHMADHHLTPGFLCNTL